MTPDEVGAELLREYGGRAFLHDVRRRGDGIVRGVEADIEWAWDADPVVNFEAELFDELGGHDLLDRVRAEGDRRLENSEDEDGDDPMLTGQEAGAEISIERGDEITIRQIRRTPFDHDKFWE